MQDAIRELSQLTAGVSLDQPKINGDYRAASVDWKKTTQLAQQCADSLRTGPSRKLVLLLSRFVKAKIF